MAEIIKYGLILDKDLFETIRNNFDELLLKDNICKLMIKIIIRCIELKSMIVEQDEEDRDNRWGAGYTIAYPTTLGWLHPTNFINEQNQTN